MNVMLTRLPDGTVNAEPGDLIDYYENGKWVEGFYFVFSGVNEATADVTVNCKAEWGRPIPISRIRHARGGAGHLRLQVARLCEALKEINDKASRGLYENERSALSEVVNLSSSALYDDSYEYTEPEA